MLPPKSFLDWEEMVNLSIARAETSEKLAGRIATGNELLTAASEVWSERQYEQWTLSKSRWTRFTDDALRLIYEGGDQADEFDACFVHMATGKDFSYANSRPLDFSLDRVN